MMRPMTPLSRDLHPSNGRRASADGVVVPITAAHRVVKPSPVSPTHPEDDDVYSVTGVPDQAHLQILELLAQGYDDEMVARELRLDLSALRALIAELAAATGACNRFQLALRTRDLGWI